MRMALAISLIAVLCSCGGGQPSSKPPDPPQGPLPAVPQISSVSPSHIPLGQAATLSIEGSNFVRETFASWNRSPRPTAYVDNAHLAVTLSAADTAQVGAVPLYVTTPPPGGGVSPDTPVVVAYPAAVLTSLVPSNAALGSGPITLRVLGSKFSPGAVVRWTDVNGFGASRHSKFISGTELQTTLAADDLAISGGAQVMVVNPDPTLDYSNQLPFTIVPPTAVLSSVTPDSIIGGTAFAELTLTGSGFQPNSVVQYNGQPVWMTKYDSPTQLRGWATFNDLLKTAGTYSITVDTPGGGTSAALTLHVTPSDPAITTAYQIAAPPTARSVYAANMSASARFVTMATDGGQFENDTCIGAVGSCTTQQVQISPYIEGEAPAVSENGRYVAFLGEVAGVVGNAVVQRDTCRGAGNGCTPADRTISSAGQAQSPAMSPDARYVAFSLPARGFPAGDAFVADTCTNAVSCQSFTTKVSVNPDGTNMYGSQMVLSILGGGRYAAVLSSANNANGVIQFAVRDTCIGAPVGCVPSTRDLNLPRLSTVLTPSVAISSDQRYVVLHTTAAFLPEDTNSDYDVYLWDTCYGAGSSCAPSYQRIILNGGSSSTLYPASLFRSTSVSSDGRYVAFSTGGSIVVANDTNGVADVFVRDTCTNAPAGCVPRTVRISVDSSGVQGNGGSALAAMTPDGQWLLYVTAATNMANFPLGGTGLVLARNPLF